MNDKCVPEAAPRPMSASERPMLTVQPLEADNNTQRDYPYLSLPFSLRARPTTRFLVSWNGHGENFQREVNSVAELNAVLKPIFAEHAHGRKLVLAERAKLDRKAKQANAAGIRKRLEMLKAEAKGLEKALADIT